MDGLRVARAIRDDPALSDTRIVMLTSSSAMGQREAAAEAGIRALLTKPVRQVQLLSSLAQLLGGHEPAPAAAPARPAVPAGSRGRILVAEDNPVNQQVVTKMLASLGYESDIAADGQAAVEHVASQPYAAVLMDCQMPVLDGFAATRTIRASGGPRAGLPIIALTASALASDQEECRSAGMDDFLSKPLRREVLAETLARWVPPLVPAAHDGATAEAAPETVRGTVPEAAPEAAPGCRGPMRRRSTRRCSRTC